MTAVPALVTALPALVRQVDLLSAAATQDAADARRCSQALASNKPLVRGGWEDTLRRSQAALADQDGWELVCRRQILAGTCDAHAPEDTGVAA